MFDNEILSGSSPSGHLGWDSFLICNAISRKRCEIELRSQSLIGNHNDFRFMQKSMDMNGKTLCNHRWPNTVICYTWALFSSAGTWQLSVHQNENI